MRVAALRAAGLAAPAGIPAFDLSLDRVGAFRGAGIAWAGASSVPAELARLVSQLNDALTAEGFQTDPRPFQAHVTLARRCRRQPRANQATPIAWAVATLVLNASDLRSGGPRYRELAAWPLGPRDGRDPWVQLPRVVTPGVPSCDSISLRRKLARATCLTNERPRAADVPEGPGSPTADVRGRLAQRGRARSTWRLAKEMRISIARLPGTPAIRHLIECQFNRTVISGGTVCLWEFDSIFAVTIPRNAYVGPCASALPLLARNPAFACAADARRPPEHTRAAVAQGRPHSAAVLPARACLVAASSLAARATAWPQRNIDLRSSLRRRTRSKSCSARIEEVARRAVTRPRYLTSTSTRPCRSSVSTRRAPST